MRGLTWVIGLFAVLGATTTVRCELLGYWSADSTGGAGEVLPNDQGDDTLDGELVEVEYSPSGSGHTGQPGDYALSFPGEDTDYVTIPPTETTFDEITITAWVNGFQRGAWAGIVLSRDPNQAIGIDYHNLEGSLTYIWNDNSADSWGFTDPDLEIPEDEWAFVALTVSEENAGLHVGTGGTLNSVINDIEHFPQDNFTEWRLGEDDCCGTERNFEGLIDDVSIWDERLSEDQLQSLLDGTQTPLSLAGLAPPNGNPALQAGDADMDLDFDQLDLVQVSIAGKYLSGTAATWGEGDWDGAPGGEQGSPPAGDGSFNQLDIISALNADVYLKGPYAAIAKGGIPNDGQTSVVYDAGTGEVKVDAPAGKELTSVNITSAGSLFIGDKPAVLDGAFDNFGGDNIFKATFGGSFGSISFGNVLESGLAEEAVAGDLSVVGSLAGGGDLGDVDLIYIPEPSSMLLGFAALLICAAVCRRRN